MLSLTSIILIGLVFAGPVTSDVCPPQTLVKLSNSIYLAGCTADTGLSMNTLSSVTADQIMDLCESSFCMAFLNEVAAENLGDCTIPGLNVFVESDLLNQIMTLCSETGSAGSMSNGSSSSGNDTNVGDESSNGDNTSGRNNLISASSPKTMAVGLVAIVAAALTILM